MGAAILIPVVEGNRGPALLMELRSDEVPQPGEICFPGGHIEAGETAAEAAVRETTEELGIPASAIEVLCELPPEKMQNGKCINVICGKIEQSAIELIKLSESEVKECFCAPLRWFRENPPAFHDMALGPDDPTIPAKLAQYMKNYETLAGRTPYWEYEGRGIWGLTARIILRSMEYIDELL